MCVDPSTLLATHVPSLRRAWPPDTVPLVVVGRDAARAQVRKFVLSPPALAVESEAPPSPTAAAESEPHAWTLFRRAVDRSGAFYATRGFHVRRAWRKWRRFDAAMVTRAGGHSGAPRSVLEERRVAAEHAARAKTAMVHRTAAYKALACLRASPAIQAAKGLVSLLALVSHVKRAATHPMPRQPSATHSWPRARALAARSRPAHRLYVPRAYVNQRGPVVAWLTRPHLPSAGRPGRSWAWCNRRPPRAQPTPATPARCHRTCGPCGDTCWSSCRSPGHRSPRWRQWWSAVRVRCCKRCRRRCWRRGGVAGTRRTLAARAMTTCHSRR